MLAGSANLRSALAALLLPLSLAACDCQGPTVTCDPGACDAGGEADAGGAGSDAGGGPDGGAHADGGSDAGVAPDGGGPMDGSVDGGADGGSSSDGGACTSCSPPVNGEALCQQGQCQVWCHAGFNLCQGACVAESALSCGPTCQVCPSPGSLAIATCDGGACDVSCTAGAHLCQGSCVREDATSCGPSCQTCPAPPANATASCDAGTCGFGCRAGFVWCGGLCLTEDPSNCGATCAVCTQAPANGSAACVAGACDYTCNPGYVRCASGCCTVTWLETHYSFAALRTSGGDHRVVGDNSDRQLGDGTTVDRAIPIPAPQIPTDALRVSVGAHHACFVTAAGGVKCWGSNAYGNLGNNGTVASSSPVDAVGLASGVVDLSAGNDSTCVVTAQGGVKCWGDNTSGVLGDGTQTLRRVPTDVTGLASGVARIVMGWSHACAITTGGGLKCWGRGAEGQLGDGVARTESTVPVDVAGLSSGVVAVALGSYHTCALRSGGALLCWGLDSDGQLGSGPTRADRNTPGDVFGLDAGVVALPNALGWHHSCALLSGGAVRCWGRSTEGQVGDGTTSTRRVPTAVTGLDAGVSALTLGYQHSCALSSAGAVSCWGRNNRGQLGDGTFTNRLAPVPMTPR